MIAISDLIAPGGVLAGARAPTKKALFTLLAEKAAGALGVDAAVVHDSIVQRERLGTTGFGGGVAIPHGRLPGLPQPLVILATLDPPLDYESLDGEPVDIVVLLLTAAEQGAEHLKTLARLSRALRDRKLIAKLRGAASADAMLAILASEPQTRAA